MYPSDAAPIATPDSSPALAVLGRAGGGGEGEGKGEVGGTRGLEGMRFFGGGSAKRAAAIVQVLRTVLCWYFVRRVVCATPLCDSFWHRLNAEYYFSLGDFFVCLDVGFGTGSSI